MNISIYGVIYDIINSNYHMMCPREAWPLLRVRGSGAPQLCMQHSAAVSTSLCLRHGGTELWGFSAGIP